MQIAPLPSNLRCLQKALLVVVLLGVGLHKALQYLNLAHSLADESVNLMAVVADLVSQEERVQLVWWLHPQLLSLTRLFLVDRKE